MQYESGRAATNKIFQHKFLREKKNVSPPVPSEINPSYQKKKPWKSQWPFRGLMSQSTSRLWRYALRFTLGSKIGAFITYSASGQPHCADPRKGATDRGWGCVTLQNARLANEFRDRATTDSLTCKVGASINQAASILSAAEHRRGSRQMGGSGEGPRDDWLIANPCGRGGRNPGTTDDKIKQCRTSDPFRAARRGAAVHSLMQCFFGTCFLFPEGELFGTCAFAPRPASGFECIHKGGRKYLRKN